MDKKLNVPKILTREDKENLLDIVWRLMTDSAYRVFWFKAGRRVLMKRWSVFYPIFKSLGLQDIKGLSEQLDRQLVSCVLFGRPPEPLDALFIKQQQLYFSKGEKEMSQSDFVSALWRSVRDPLFRKECFGDARTALAKEGYVLSNEELGKFRWFDHEKLAQFELKFKTALEDVLNRKSVNVNGMAGQVKSGDILQKPSGCFCRQEEFSCGDIISGEKKLHDLFEEHCRQVVELRRRGEELLADLPQFAPGEFDPGPPPLDRISFFGLLQLMRVWKTDINAILRDSGYSFGRLMMLSQLMERKNITLPLWRSDLTDNAPACRDWFCKIIAEGRPKINEVFHQSPCDPRAVIGRVEHMVRHNWLRNRPVLVLGDDDGISLVLAKYTQAQVHVVDIDDRVISFLKKAAKREKLKVSFHLRDLRKDLPAAMVNRFVLVCADPPQSAKGEVFFLDRAIEALQPYLGCRIYCSVTPLWMGNEAYYSVLSHMTRKGFFSREILKSQMVFPVQNTFDKPLKSTATGKFIKEMMCDIINMGCDVHVFQRFKSF